VWIFHNFGLKLLSVAIALFLWIVAQGTSSIERGFDIPVVLQGVPEDLVVTDQGADVVNFRVMGSRAALRTIDGSKLEYDLDVGGAKAGENDYEVDLMSRVDLPRGARMVSRSPSRIQVTFERRATRPVEVRADLEGEPAPGYKMLSVTVEPPRVRITGARSEVLRLSEVVTETVDVSGAKQPVERDVRVSTGVGHVWPESPKPVKVRVDVQPLPQVGPPAPSPVPALGGAGTAAGTASGG
jgi:YbbR domain-containing protein